MTKTTLDRPTATDSARAASLPRLASRAVLLGLLGLGIGACGTESNAADPADDSVSIGGESVAVVAAEEIRSGPAISGTLTAQREAAVRAETGGSVLAVNKAQGEAVAAGELLARIEGSTARDAYLSAQSTMRSAQHALEVARRDLERAEKLAAAGAISDRDVELARNGVAAAQAQLAGAQAQLSNAQRQVRNTEIRAPFSGVISARPVNAGDVVGPGTALFTVIDPASMRLEASVPSEQLGEVRVGAPVEFTVSGYPGRTFTGTIERINPAADAATRQVPIYVSIPNTQGALVAGLFAQGRVASESRQTLVVPLGAVDQRGVTPTVLRVKGGTTERVPVEVGISDAETQRVEITAGLAAGDTVLTGAALGISPNTRVRVGAPAARP